MIRNRFPRRLLVSDHITIASLATWNAISSSKLPASCLIVADQRTTDIYKSGCWGHCTKPCFWPDLLFELTRIRLWVKIWFSVLTRSYSNVTSYCKACLIPSTVTGILIVWRTTVPYGLRSCGVNLKCRNRRGCFWLLQIPLGRSW